MPRPRAASCLMAGTLVCLAIPVVYHRRSAVLLSPSASGAAAAAQMNAYYDSLASAARHETAKRDEAKREGVELRRIEHSVKRLRQALAATVTATAKSDQEERSMLMKVVGQVKAMKKSGPAPAGTQLAKDGADESSADGSLPHYYVTGEYGKGYDEVYKKLFSQSGLFEPGEPVPIHARGGIFEDAGVAAHPLPGKRMITRIHKIELAGNISCDNCIFLGQNSKVVINHAGANATDSGEDDSDQHSIFDVSESLYPREIQRLSLAAPRAELPRPTHSASVARRHAEQIRQRFLRKHRERLSSSQAVRVANAAAQVARTDAAMKELRRSTGSKGTATQTQLRLVEDSNALFQRALGAVAKSNAILKARLAALKATRRLFQ